MNTEDKPDAAYSPRPGSKITAAIQAMLDGPMTAEALGALMHVPSCNVPAMLKKPLQHRLITRWQDSSGLVHFACGGMQVDEKFKPYEAPTVRKPFQRLQKIAPPERESFDYNDPFGHAVKKMTTTNGATAILRPAVAAQHPPLAKVQGRPTEPALQHPVATTALPEEPDGQFVAALFSTGELLIQVGTASVKLSREHQRQLQQYVSRFKEN